MLLNVIADRLIVKCTRYFCYFYTHDVLSII